MNKLIQSKYLFVFFLMCLTTLPFLNRGLYESSESRYARVAQTMNQVQEYWIPQLNHQSHLTKPPLTYWIIAGGLKLFGDNNVGARFFHALAAILAALIIVRIGTLIDGDDTGFLAGVIFSTSFLSSFGTWALTTDVFVLLFQVLAFWTFCEFQNKPTLKWKLLFWISIGLAFNVKGPIATAPVVLWSLCQRPTAKRLSQGFIWILAILIASFWYVSLEIKRPGILSKLIHEEIVLRSTTDLSERNPQWWAAIPLYWLPLICGSGWWLVFIGRKKLVELWKLKNHEYPKMMLYWILTFLLFFSLVKSRLTLYILPLSLPLSLLLAWFVEDRKSINKVLLTNLLIILCLKTYVSHFYRSDFNAENIAQFSTQHTNVDHLYSFGEKSIYGLEFYLKDRFQKTANASELKSGFVLLQKKKLGYLVRRSRQRFNLKELDTFGKWMVVKLESK